MKICDYAGNVHIVRKYVISNDGEESVWSNTWYGRHVIGNDCKWVNESKPQSEPLLDSGLVKELVSIRNKLYNELPTSEINAFDLITLIKWHINDLDIFCSKLAAASTVSEATTDEDTIGFAEWVVSDNNPAPNKYNSDDDNNGKWCDAFSEGINRHYYTTEQLYQLYRKQSKQ